VEDAASFYDGALTDYKNGNLDGAAQKLTALLEIDPSFEDAYEALSVILYNQKRYDEAMAVLKKWTAVNPDALMAHTNLSRCYVAKGMILEAEQEQAEARRLTWKAELKAKNRDVPKIDYEEQIARFKKVIDLDPVDVLGYFSLGNVYLDSGKKREALETFEKAVDVDPKHSASFYGLGLALEGLGDVKKARSVYERGIQVAEERGDMMTQRKMESRLRALGA
jgi:tetratricopeptide (TPR) repeat protein